LAAIPDGYSLATTTYISRDYDTEVAGQIRDVNNIVEMAYDASGGYTNGAWRARPQPIDGTDANEDNAGWESGLGSPDNIPVDDTQIVVVSYMFKISSALVTEILSGGTTFWDHENKVIDFFMWLSDGTNVDADTRQTVFFGADSGELVFSHVAGGGGGQIFTGGTRTDFADFADEWVFVAHVLDASGADDTARYTRTYMARSGDSAFTKVAERRGDADGGGGGDDSYKYTTRGWYGDQGRTVWGYWDDMNGGASIYSVDKYISLDRLRISNGWVNPPDGFLAAESGGGEVATLGNTMNGASTRDISTLIKGIRVPSFPADATINSITATVQGDNSSSWRAMVYTQAGDLVASSAIRNNITTKADYEFTFTAGDLEEGGDYTFAVGTDQAASAIIYFNGGSETYEGQAYASVTDIYPDAPASVTWTADTTRDYSITVTYTEDAAPAAGSTTGGGLAGFSYAAAVRSRASRRR
jgi:hypothetical protein